MSPSACTDRRRYRRHLPDFDPGQPLRVLPERVSSIWPSEAGPVVDDGWTFLGPTRHLQRGHPR